MGAWWQLGRFGFVCGGAGAGAGGGGGFAMNPSGSEVRLLELQ